MKYLLLIISILLISYPIYGLISCLQAIGHLSSYGMGVLSGCLLFLALGILLLFFTIKLFKRKTQNPK
jgi:pilus assembly protein TadC